MYKWIYYIIQIKNWHWMRSNLRATKSCVCSKDRETLLNLQCVTTQCSILCAADTTLPVFMSWKPLQWESAVHIISVCHTGFHANVLSLDLCSQYMKYPNIYHMGDALIWYLSPVNVFFISPHKKCFYRRYLHFLFVHL